jgi:hypothetical protein
MYQARSFDKSVDWIVHMGPVSNFTEQAGNFMRKFGNLIGQVGNLKGQDGIFVGHKIRIGAGS